MAYEPKVTIPELLDLAANTGKFLQVQSDGSILGVIAPSTAGAPGANGAPGNVLYNGSSVPSNSLGINGDYYILLVAGTGNGNLYQKVSGAWGLQGNMQGPAGGTGAQGVAGATGAQGVQGIAGLQGIPGGNGTNGVSFVWRGVWSGGTSYSVNDVVNYGGSAWVAILANSGVTPGTDITRWNLIAQQGATGAL